MGVLDNAPSVRQSGEGGTWPWLCSSDGDDEITLVVGCGVLFVPGDCCVRAVRLASIGGRTNGGSCQHYSAATVHRRRHPHRRNVPVRVRTGIVERQPATWRAEDEVVG